MAHPSYIHTCLAGFPSRLFEPPLALYLHRRQNTENLEYVFTLREGFEPMTSVF
jgi:hypothetical protein